MQLSLGGAIMAYVVVRRRWTFAAWRDVGLPIRDLSVEVEPNGDELPGMGASAPSEAGDAWTESRRQSS